MKGEPKPDVKREQSPEADDDGPTKKRAKVG